MPVLEWNDSYKVNIDVIDEQHKNLFDLVKNYDANYQDSRLYSNMAEGPKRHELYLLILNLRRFFLAHFSSEEELMIKCRYKDFLTHKKEHDRFIVTMLNLESKFLSGDLMVARDLHEFLVAWVIEHTTQTDTMYVDDFSKSFNKDGELIKKEDK